MKMNKGGICAIVMVLAILCPLLSAAYIHYQRNNFNCESHVTIVDKQEVVDIIMTFSFNNGVGNYQVSGEYIKDNQPPVAISNNVSFNYWREEGSIIMVSTETNELPKKSLPYRAWIPDFFQHRERGIRMTITAANADSYYLSYSHSPVMYCTKG
ncbi:MAG: hypothetical protein RSE29_04810 [Leclercia sp.]